MEQLMEQAANFWKHAYTPCIAMTLLFSYTYYGKQRSKDSYTSIPLLAR